MLEMVASAYPKAGLFFAQNIAVKLHKARDQQVVVVVVVGERSKHCRETAQSEGSAGSSSSSSRGEVKTLP
jgi:hypothetical protein